jgi:hypothetical protein
MKITVKFAFLFILLPLFSFNTLALAQIPNYVPQNGLVGWWPFNGNANDESGNGNNGTRNCVGIFISCYDYFSTKRLF